MIYLTKIDPAKNMHRFYRLSIEPTLFGDYALVREWGRIKAKSGQTKEQWHTSALDAGIAFSKALQCRMARGYGVAPSHSTSSF